MNGRRIPTPLDRALFEGRVTNRALADAIGVNESQVSRWRHGVHVPEQATREAIAQELGRKVVDLWPEQQEMKAAA